MKVKTNNGRNRVSLTTKMSMLHRMVKATIRQTPKTAVSDKGRSFVDITKERARQKRKVNYMERVVVI